MLLALHRIRVKIGGQDATLEVADSQMAMEQGLSGRASLVPDCGMIFDPGSQCSAGFHMENTYMPLTVAFADRHGKIFETADLVPMSKDVIKASQPWRYAIEMARGWFDDCSGPCIIDPLP